MKNLCKILFLPSLFIFCFSCSKDSSDPTPVPTPIPVPTPTPTPSPTGITINSAPQFNATINGSSISYVSGSNNYEASLGANKSINIPAPTTAAYTSEVSSSTTGKGAGVWLGTLSFSGSIASNTDFDNFISTGNHPYSVDAANGIHIYWFDSNTSEYWSTSYGTGDQTGSTFNISQVSTSNVLGNHYVKFISTFSCKLYNYSTGASIILTNGTFVGHFENM